MNELERTPYAVTAVNTDRVRRVAPANPAVAIHHSYDNQRLPAKQHQGAEKKFRKALLAHIQQINTAISALGWQFQLLRLLDENGHRLFR